MAINGYNVSDYHRFRITEIMELSDCGTLCGSHVVAGPSKKINL